MLDWIFHLLNHPWVPWSGSGLIAAWGLGEWLVVQQRCLIPIRQRLTHDCQSLDRGTTPSLSIIGQSVVSPTDYTVLRPRLTLEKVLGKGWDAYYLQTVPYRFLGMGLFFTLIGLAAALFFVIQELHADTLAGARQALDGLLLSAMLKFLSSISGLCTASLFSWGIKRQRGRLERQLEGLCQRVDEGIARHEKTVWQPPSPLMTSPPQMADPLSVTDVAAATDHRETAVTETVADLTPFCQTEVEKYLDKTTETPDTDTEKPDEKPTVETMPEPIAMPVPTAMPDRVTRPDPTTMLDSTAMPNPAIVPVPMATPAPTATPAPMARGPAFARLAGEFLQARQQRKEVSMPRRSQASDRNPPSVTSVQQAE